MDDVPVGQTLDCDVATTNNWPLVFVALLFFAGVGPAFLPRPAPPPTPPPTSGESCTSTPTPATNAATQSGTSTPAVEAKRSC